VLEPSQCLEAAKRTFGRASGNSGPNGAGRKKSKRAPAASSPSGSSYLIVGLTGLLNPT